MASITPGNNLEIRKTTFRNRPKRPAQRIVHIRDEANKVDISILVSEKGRNAQLFVDSQLILEFDPRARY